MSKSNKKKWLKVSEFAMVGVATWLNPHAGFLLFLLRLCFQILAALQKDEPDETEQGKQTPNCQVVVVPRDDHFTERGEQGMGNSSFLTLLSRSTKPKNPE